jgi:hypothetical protein
VAEDSSNPDQTCTATWDNTYVLPGVLALLALTMVLVVQTGDSCSERLDTSSRTIFTGFAWFSSYLKDRSIADLPSMETGMLFGRTKLPSMSSSTSGAPWPKLAQA